MMSSQVRSPVDDLPKQFVSAMRTLFDIMDDRKTGFIRFTDIHLHWQEDEAKGLPKGVIDSLRKVTPPNGLLSFERFCAGLKICLLRNKSEQTTPRPPELRPENVKSLISNREIENISRKPPPLPPFSKEISQQKSSMVRPQSVPADRLMRDHEMAIGKPLMLRQNSTSNIPPPQYSNVVPTKSGTSTTPMVRSRTVSLPHLGEKKLSERPTQQTHDGAYFDHRGSHSTKNLAKATGTDPSPTSSRSNIMATLHNWHMGLRASSENNSKRITVDRAQSARPPADGRAVGQDGGAISDGDVNVSIRDSANKNVKRLFNNRRREPRRHTLASGIDYNMLKRMKQLEQEKDVLLQGLEAVDKAHDWYLKQIANVQDKMKYIGKSTTQLEYSTEAHQEKLNFQMARIFEVNQHLSALVESSERGFPFHMNLAIQPMVSSQRFQRSLNRDDVTVRRLKEQNHQLTEEVSRKSERITKLEREKSSLVRELFQARSQNRREIDDTTFL